MKLAFNACRMSAPQSPYPMPGCGRSSVRHRLSCCPWSRSREPSTSCNSPGSPRWPTAPVLHHARIPEAGPQLVTSHDPELPTEGFTMKRLAGYRADTMRPMYVALA